LSGLAVFSAARGAIAAARAGGLALFALTVAFVVAK
jgi:hypothetical protein